MKLFNTNVKLEILKQAESWISDPHRILVGTTNSDGITQVWYGEPEDLFLFGRKCGIAGTVHYLRDHG